MNLVHLVHFTINICIKRVCVVNCRLSGDPYNYNILPPLPARNIMSSSAQHLQQPVSISDNHDLPRFMSDESPYAKNSRSKRADINIWRGKAFLPACWIVFRSFIYGFPLGKADFFSSSWLLEPPFCAPP